MLITLNFFYIIIGIALLYYGGDLLVDNASKVAKKFKLPGFFIGVVIIGLGTSLPELCVSLLAAVSGLNDISLANVVGSNITNIALVLGFVSIIFQTSIPKKNLFDMLFLLFAYILSFVALSNIKNIEHFDIYNLKNLFENSVINRIEGGVFLLVIVVYLIINYKRGGIEEDVEDVLDTNNINIPLAILFIVLSIAFLVGGSKVLIMGSVYIAENVFHLSQRIIGLTIVAIGTSLPEFSSSLIASIKKEHSMSLGNIVGSCMFNVLLILGSTALVSPIKISDTGFIIDYIMMFAMLIILMIFGLLFKKVPRLGGIIFMVIYLGYMIFGLNL